MDRPTTDARRDADAAVTLSAAPDPAADPVDAAAVRAALLALGALDREVVVLRFRDGLALGEIAALTESTLGEVHQRLRRGALAVEEAVGGRAVLAGVDLTGVDEDVALEDLQVGISPQLAARLRRATTSGSLPALTIVPVPRRRLRAEAWLRRNTARWTTLSLLGGGAVATALALAGAG